MSQGTIRMTRGRAGVIATSMVALGLVSCSGAAPKPHEEAVPVVVATATKKDVPVQIRAVGSVATISTVAVKTLVGGELTRVWFREGDDVVQGQRLFTIDPRQYEAAVAQAEASLERDEAQLRNAEAQAARYATLVKSDYVTKQEFDSFESAAAVARANAAADRAALQNARLQLAYCDIRSPIDGRTGNLMVQAGNVVKANDVALVTINQIAPVYVQFAVPESRLDEIRAVHDLARIKVGVFSREGGTDLASGTLVFIDNAVDTTTGTIRMKALFPNKDRALWPGQFVDLVLTVSTRVGATVVPTQAVQTSQKGQYIYVVRQDGGVDMREVSVVTSDDREAVIGSGVAAGEVVVTDGQLRLTPKSKVKTRELQEQGQN